MDFDVLVEKLSRKGWEELYTGGNISWFLKDFKDKNGNIFLIVIHDEGYSFSFPHIKEKRLITKKEFLENQDIYGCADTIHVDIEEKQDGNSNGCYERYFIEDLLNEQDKNEVLKIQKELDKLYS